MALIDELNKKKTQIEKEIKRRGGPAKATNFVAQLEQVNAQIAGMSQGSAGDETSRINDRIKFLQRTRPNDPEIKRLQDKLRTSNPNPDGTTAAPPVSEGVKNDIVAQNPNVTGPTGSSTTVIGPDGNPVIKQELSADQQAILDQEEGLTKTARDLATNRIGSLGTDFAPDTVNRISTDNALADRARIEDQVYGRLTKNVDQEYGNNKQAKAQELQNKGIPFSGDPNSRYQQELRAMDERYDGLKMDARARAAEIGGQEWQRAVGLNETVIGNQYGQQLGTRQQNNSEIGQLGQTGAGLIMPNFSAPVGSTGANPTNLSALELEKKKAKQAYDLAMKQLAKQGGGGGSSSPAPDAGDPAFSGSSGNL